MTGKCELCGRENVLTFHHLIPVCLHKNKWFKKNFSREEMARGINVFKYDCHREIHNVFSEKELGRSFYTLDKLLRHPKIKKYVKYIQKQ